MSEAARTQHNLQSHQSSESGLGHVFVFVYDKWADHDARLSELNPNLPFAVTKDNTMQLTTCNTRTMQTESKDMHDAQYRLSICCCLSHHQRQSSKPLPDCKTSGIVLVQREGPARQQSTADRVHRKPCDARPPADFACA